jgi:hypothetical protein
MLTWDDIRAIDSIADPVGVLSVYVDRPDPDGGGRLVRAVAVAAELRRLEHDAARAAGGETAAAYREAVARLRPALVRALDGDAPGRALFAPLSGGEVFDLGVGMPVGLSVALEPTAYVRPLVAAFDEGRPAGIVVARPGAVQLHEWRMGSVEEVGEHVPAGPPAALARAVGRAARERGWRRVLVAGDGRVAAALVAAADADGPGREVSPVSRWVDGLAPGAIAAAVGADLRAAQRRYERRLVERAVDAALYDQTAVLGAGATLDALVAGRVGHLLLDGERDYRLAGAAAAAGGWLRRDPAERLIELALHAGADITPLEGGSRDLLTEADGVAAILR